jgi:acetyl esterase/lipase
LSLLTFLMKFRWLTRLMDKLSNRSARGKAVETLQCEEAYIPSSDGAAQIRVRIYRPREAAGELPLMLYIHGGGYIMGCPEMTNDFYERFIETRPCVIVAPDYRKAWTKPFPAGLDDCYDTLLWAIGNADDLGIRRRKVIVAGHSAGGGLTAAVTLKARDQGDVDIAFQMPFYPMIDDRQPSDPAREIHTPVWDTTMNRIGWGSYLADLQRQQAEIPAYAAPARNADYSGFPPTITFVGTLEPFFWETRAYVEALRAADVDVAYKEYEGCFHAFELFAGNKPVGRDGMDFTFERYAGFYDKYARDTGDPASGG